jgi:hypothetical protein
LYSAAIVEQAMTLMRFAQLTARLDGCVSRDDLLKEEGLTLEDWLRAQKYWLDELTNRIAADRPLLFSHYLSLLDQERKHLGKPPLAGTAAVQPSARKLYDLAAPQPDASTAALPGATLGQDPHDLPVTADANQVPGFLRAQSTPPPDPSAFRPPAAPAYVPAVEMPPPSPAPAFVSPTPAYVAAPYQPPEPAPYQPPEPAPYQPPEPAPYQPSEPAPYQPSEPAPYQPSEPAPYQPSEPAPYQPSEPPPVPVAAPDIPDFLVAAASIPAAPSLATSQPPLPGLSAASQPYSDVPAFLRGAPPDVDAQPKPMMQPRLRIEDYVELVFTAEQTAAHLQTQLLQRFGFDESGWNEEIRRWQQQFITQPEGRRRFEQLMLARRGYGP